MLKSSNVVYKTLVVGIIILFFVISISPVINANIFDKINNNEHIDENFCEMLMRIGIFIEELYKIFPEGTIVYPILVLMILPVILLWNKYCDEFYISYDLSITGNLQIKLSENGR